MDGISQRSKVPSFISDLKLSSPAEALLVVPSGYVDLTSISVGFSSLEAGETIIIPARLYSNIRIDTSKKDAFAFFHITDGTDILPVHCYGANAWNAFNSGHIVGGLIHVIGLVRVNPETSNITLSNARILPETRAGRVEPTYSGDSQRSSEYIEQLARNPESRAEAASIILRHFPGEDSRSVLKRCGVTNNITIEDWLFALHCPANINEANTAQMVAKRLVALEVCFQAMHLQHRQPVPGAAINLNPKQVAGLIAALPFKPTRDQQDAIVSMCEDLLSDAPTRRLISGDVGTGKTACFATVAAAAYLAGARVVILAPNLLVVDQHIEKMAEWWPHIKTMRVIGSTRMKAADLDSNPILIGTTALITRLHKLNHYPNLLIVDEQHKLSKEQREAVMVPETHYIEATATCIPRTMAVVAHGGMDLSVLRECPFQKKIATRVYHFSQRKELFEKVSAVLKTEGQVAVIYPRVEAKEDLEHDRHSFEDALKLWQDKFPGKVQGLHGKMKAEEKTAVIQAMRRKEFDLLVTTTVIEVGIDLPDLRAVAVVHADRFGLNQLHQIRGRVARHGGGGGFYLYLPEPVEADTLKRLQVLERVSDGFKLAELDLQLRGFGDLVDGTRQTGKAVVRTIRGIELDLESLRTVIAHNRINDDIQDPHHA